MSKRTLGVLTLLFLAVAFVWTRDRTRPFIGHHDGDDINWVSAAENYRRYGLWDTRLQPIMNPIPAPRREWAVNQHHPPGISLITWAGLELLGDHEFTARLLPIAACSLAAALLFRLARRWYDLPSALLGLIFFAFTPLMIYYSAKIGHEQYTLPLMLLALVLYSQPDSVGAIHELPLRAARRGVLMRFNKTTRRYTVSASPLNPLSGPAREGTYTLPDSPSPTSLERGSGGEAGSPHRYTSTALFLLALGGCFISWAWMLFLALLALYTWIVHGRRGLIRRWSLWLGGVLGVAGVIALMAWQQASFASTLRGAFEERTLNAAGASISVGKWLATVPPTLLWIPTPVVTVFALIGLRRHPWTADRGLLIVPALTGAIYSLAFWKATYYHDYLIYYLVPPLCVWASVGFFRVLYAYGWPPKPLWRGMLGLVLVTFAISSAHSAARLFKTDTFAQRYEWGILAAQVTAPDDVIVTNLPEIGNHVGYYARRAVQDGIPPDQVLADTRPAAWGFYIYFQKRDQAPPDWLASFAYHYDQASGCYLIDLK